MSLSGARVVIVVGVIMLLFGASRMSVSHAGPSTYVRGVDSDRQQPIDLVANNRAVKVALRDRSIVLHIYLPKHMSADAPLVLYSSGSGGWHQFDGYVASAFALREMPVCGISTHTYLKSFYSTSHPATVPDVISDYSHIIKEARNVVGLDSTHPIILSGWSLGAGYAPLVAADPQIKTSVRGVISLAITRDNEEALSVRNRLLSRLTGRTFGPSFDVTEYLTRAFPLPVALIQPADDQPDSSKNATRLIAATGEKAATSLRLFEVRSSSNHSFAGGRTEFDHALDEALAWINERSRQARVPRRDRSL